MQQLKVHDFVGFVDQPLNDQREPKHWYMLRVVPNREIAVEERLARQRVKVYLPKETETRKTGWNRYRARTVAIFSGAIFIPDFEADLQRLKKICDHIIGYVRCESQPVVIRPKMMEEIRKFEKLLDVPPGQRKRAFRVGQEVRIKTGPFEMWMGYVASLDRHRRLTVLVNLMGRMVPSQFEESQIEVV
ncbi:MAG: transcription termination/antitermination NusG family protein [Bryobacteraceae bacterium]